jgi:L-arabonate dehydrase
MAPAFSALISAPAARSCKVIAMEKRKLRSQAKLRSQSWFGGNDKDGFIHRSWMRNQGFPGDVFDGRPVIGICNTWSELTPCNAHFRDLAQKVKNGVWEAGGFPLEFPVTSMGETNMRPTAMMFRNLVSMDVEESIRANPIDGVVLMCGCDKTTPSLVMGAASCDVPTIVLSGGPMLNGRYRGQPIGSGTVVWQFSEAVKAGKMSQQEFMDAESCMSRSRRPLHDHGYGLDDGLHGGVAGAYPPRQCGHSGSRLAAGRAGA